MNEFYRYLEQIPWQLIVFRGVYVLLILILMSVGLRSAGVLSRKLRQLFTLRHEDPEMMKRADTLSAFIRYLLAFVIVAVGIMTILKQIGVEIAPILAGAGIVGLAVGFGAQNLVQDVISGFFILIEDQIRVGDVVEIKGKGGLVEKVGLRMTILRDFSGNVHYIRNGQIDIVTNMTKGYSNYVFDIRVSFKQDIDQVAAAVREVDEELRADPKFKDLILKPVEFYGLDSFAESYLILKARTTTKPIRQWDVGREFNKRLKKKFEERGIEIPYRQRALHVDEEKAQKAALFRAQADEQKQIGETDALNRK